MPYAFEDDEPAPRTSTGELPSPEEVRAAVEEARAQGATWSQVAVALNRTRQAVEQRFG